MMATQRPTGRARVVLGLVLLMGAASQLGLVSGCAGPSEATTELPPTRRGATSSASLPTGTSSRPASDRVAPPAVESGGAASSAARSRAPLQLTDATLRAALGPGKDEPVDPVFDDLARIHDETRYPRMIEHKWRAEPAVLAVALELWNAQRVVVGTEPAQLMDGGFRGRLHLVPESPVGPHAKHLGWLRDAYRDYDAIFAAVTQRAPALSEKRFRVQGIVYGFFRSVGRTTPSAYASGWRIAYNVSGSLNASATAVEDTLFHEIFHLNDEADRWSGTHLRAIHASILERCAQQLPSSCLAPYAPTATMVRGGTYYSFQSNNGDAVDEYGAEIATRWFQEHRAIVEASAPPKGSPWKCRNDDNARAWKLIADAFFAGVDLTPPCNAR